MTLSAAPSLTAEEERDLVTLAQGGDDDAKARLVLSQVRYLRMEARKYGAASGVDQDDLVSAGMEAFLAAIESFDPARGTRLWTHAHRWVQGAMTEEVAAFSSSLPIPARSLKRYRRAMRDVTTLVANGELAPRDALERARSIAQERDGMDPSTFDSVHAALVGGESIDSTHDTSDRVSANGYGGDGAGVVMEGGVGNTITTETPLLGSRGPAPTSDVEDRTAIRQAVATLSPRQRDVVALAYLSGEDLSDGDVAARLGISRPTVTRERNAALVILRDLLA